MSLPLWCTSHVQMYRPNQSAIATVSQWCHNQTAAVAKVLITILGLQNQASAHKVTSLVGKVSVKPLTNRVEPVVHLDTPDTPVQTTTKTGDQFQAHLCVHHSDYGGLVLVLCTLWRIFPVHAQLAEPTEVLWLTLNAFCC